MASTGQGDRLAGLVATADDIEEDGGGLDRLRGQAAGQPAFADPGARRIRPVIRLPVKINLTSSLTDDQKFDCTVRLPI